MPRPVSTAWATNSSGATNRKENSIGSVTPTSREVNAAGISIAFAAALRSGFAVGYIASAAAGRPNILLMPRASQTTVLLSCLTCGQAISASKYYVRPDKPCRIPPAFRPVRYKGRGYRPDDAVLSAPKYAQKKPVNRFTPKGPEPLIARAIALIPC